MDKIKFINSLIKTYEDSVQEIEKRKQEGAILGNDEVLQDYKDILNTYKQIKTDLEKYEDKETPKKTITKINEHNHIDRHCPVCESFVYSFDIYCGKCGQKIKSDE